MSRLGLYMSFLSAIVALIAIGSTPAWAEGKLCGAGSHLVFCYDGGEEIGVPAGEAEGTAGLSLLVATIGGAEAKADCKKGFFGGGALESLGKSKGTGAATECQMIKPVECKLSAAEEKEVQGKALGELISESGKTKIEFTGAGAGEEFTTVIVEGCSIAGTYTITGKQICELPAAEEELVEHEIVCKKSGSKLNIGSSSVSVSGTAKNSLVGSHAGLKWYVGKGE